MKEYIFTSIRWIDGKQKKIIVDICGHIINRNPTKEELIDIRPEISRRQLDKLSGEYRKQYLLEFLRYFNEKEGRPPTLRDFENNSEYPSYKTYANIFGSWLSALKQIGLDKESMTIKGVIETGNQKVISPEIKVRNRAYIWFRQIEDRKVIVDICGHVVNRNPTKEELKGIKRELSRIEGNKDKDILLEFLRYFNEKEAPAFRRE